MSDCFSSDSRSAHPPEPERAAALTVESQDGWRERRWVGEGELDRVLSGPLQQLRSLLALLLHTLLLPFLLLSGQSILGLLLLSTHPHTHKLIKLISSFAAACWS